MKRLPPNGLFMDIGGGNGFVSMAVQEAGWPVVLMEPGMLGARNARHRGIQNVICSTLEDAGIMDGTLTSAGAFDVVEHIEHDAAFLKSVARALIPGGRLYLTVPSLPSLWSHEDEDAGHFRRYTTASLRRVLSQSGLQVEYLTYFFNALTIPIFLLRTMPHKLGQRRKPTAAEHRGLAGPLKSLHDNFLKRELTLIRAGRTMAFGSSCLAVARKS